MSKKLLLPLFIVISIVLSSALAAAIAEFVVIPAPGFLNLKEEEVGKFEITIQNNMETEERFEIYVPEVTWDLTTIPSRDRIVTLQPGERKTVQAEIRPLYVNPGLYGVELNVRVSGKKMLISNYLTVNVGAAYTPADEYLPAIRTVIDMPEEVDPREEVTITLFLENQNRRNIDVADIKIRSNLINKDYSTSLKPLEKKSVDFSVQLDPLTEPQEDVLRTTIFAPTDRKTFQFEIIPPKFNVIQYGGLESNESIKKGFFKTIKTITVTNKGNARYAQPFTLESTLFEQWFTSAVPEASSFEVDGKKQVGWEVTLAPGASSVFVVTVSYVPLLIIILIVGGFAALYIFLRPPIVVEKNATVLATKEGGISELKILIILKNRSPQRVKSVSVIDKVSHIADIIKDHELGTLKPSKVLKHQKKGTLIKWELKELDAGEERILSYKIKSRLSVLGDFVLPVAVAKYMWWGARERVTHSNTVTLTTK